MTGEDIKEQIENKLGLTFEDDIVQEVFNEALMDLAEVLRLETKATANLTSDHEEVAWPSNSDAGDVLEIIMVEMEKAGKLRMINIDDDKSRGFKLFGGQFAFQNVDLPDKGVIWYYRYPTMIDDLSEEPDISKRFRHALKYYFIAVYQQEDEELKLEENYLAKYYRVKTEIDRHTRKQKGMHRTRKGRARSWA